ncbi:MAG: ATP synthase F1 subunit epsilon [Flavobacteriales bacterium]|jgi:F-type H+-transporting ATPase subunit epsilon|nr:ATP synthase F1 subunit epsilon [Flavobacteriales bacterium]
MFLEIIKPDAELYKGEIISVRVPGKKGSFEILTNHMPIVSTLDEGTIRVIDANNKTETFEVKGGVLEMNNNKIIILAD